MQVEHIYEKNDELTRLSSCSQNFLQSIKSRELLRKTPSYNTSLHFRQLLHSALVECCGINNKYQTYIYPTSDRRACLLIDSIVDWIVTPRCFFWEREWNGIKFCESTGFFTDLPRIFPQRKVIKLSCKAVASITIFHYRGCQGRERSSKINFSYDYCFHRVQSISCCTFEKIMASFNQPGWKIKMSF